MLCLAVLAGCGDDGSGPVDAAPTGDAVSDAAADAPIDAPGNLCTGAPYDPCTDNTQCMSNDCRLFMGQGIQVCTQACDANNPCPMQNGAAVQCNNMGRCRPDAANACTR